MNRYSTASELLSLKSTRSPAKIFVGQLKVVSVLSTSKALQNHETKLCMRQFAGLQLKRFLHFWVFHSCHLPRFLDLLLVSPLPHPHHFPIAPIAPPPGLKEYMFHANKGLFRFRMRNEISRRSEKIETRSKKHDFSDRNSPVYVIQ